MVSLTRLNRGSLDKVNQTLLPIDKTDLIAYWPFWENAGATLYDESKNGNDGTINGATWGWSNFSKPVLDFDGTDDWVDIPNDFGIFGGGQDFTVLVWVNTDVLDSAWHEVWTAEGENDVMLRIDDANAWRITVGSGGSWYEISSAVDATDTWYLVGMRWKSGTSFSLWVDAVEEATDTSGLSSIDSSADDSALGQRLSTEYWDGTMHGVLIYGRALTDSEITRIYEKTRL